MPEPLPHELDEMARTAGLHTGDGEASPEVRATTLRLVRALRIVFGPETEQDKPAHARLLRGIGAMETLRANDKALSRFTPFRMELWTFIAQRVGAAGKTRAPTTTARSWTWPPACGRRSRKPPSARPSGTRRSSTRSGRSPSSARRSYGTCCGSPSRRR